MSDKPPDAPTASGVWVSCGVDAFSGSPFCALFVDGAQVAQLDVDATFALAFQAMRAAERARLEAGLLPVLREDRSLAEALALLSALRRQARSQEGAEEGAPREPAAAGRDRCDPPEGM